MPSILQAATATPAPLPQTTMPRSQPPREHLARDVDGRVGVVVLIADVDGLVAGGGDRGEHDVAERHARVVEADGDPHDSESRSSSWPASSAAPRTPARGP